MPTKGLVRPLSARLPVLGAALGLIFIAYFVGRSVVDLSEAEASEAGRAESFGREVLAIAPQNAILFAKEDEAIFALWYFHFALGERPGLTVVAEAFLQFDWYQEDQRATYRSLIVPGPFPWSTTLASANPSRAICYVRYSDRTEVNCSPSTKPP